MKTTKMIKSFHYSRPLIIILFEQVSSYGGTIITLLLLGFPEEKFPLAFVDVMEKTWVNLLAKLIKKLDSGGYATYLRTHAEQNDSGGSESPIQIQNTLYYNVQIHYIINLHPFHDHRKSTQL